MLKKVVKFTDYDGNPREEELYFNLSKAELAEMEASQKEGLENYIGQMVVEKDTNKIFKLFKELILMSYGRKSYDGKTFIKREMRDGQMVRLRDEFEQSEAFSEVLMGMIEGGEEAIAAFINQVIPKELADEVNKRLASGEELPVKFPAK